MTKPVAGARPVIHRAVRGEAFDHQSPPMSLANAPCLLQSLQPITLCERSQPQAECWNRKAR